MDPKPYTEPDTESGWLTLAGDAQRELDRAIRSLLGKTLPPNHTYCAHIAAYLNRAAYGFVVLRRQNLFAASQLMVRPALEALFRISAVMEDAGMLYRVAFTESMDELTMLRDSPNQGLSQEIAALEKQWADTKAAYAIALAGFDLRDEKVSAEALARAGKLRPFYAVQYRLYCKHTHGALRVTIGG
ncbi:MAG TPA: DUF5677 domain-containing protein, partial [Candidatus Didemnitutus sp.]